MATEWLSNKLERPFYERDTVLVARELLGCYLIHVFEDREHVGRIVEVEAYLGEDDLAAHAAKGVTPRTRILFGPPGHAYVYLIYGIHCCFNVVTEIEGKAGAVLVRALEPVANITGRTTGPGLLCRALNIDLKMNAHDLLSNDLFLSGGTVLQSESSVGVSPRIGVDYSGEWALAPLRFFLKGCPYLSRR